MSPVPWWLQAVEAQPSKPRTRTAAIWLSRRPGSNIPHSDYGFPGAADSPMAPTTCLRLFVSLFPQHHHSLRWTRWMRVPTSQLGTLRPTGVKEQPQSSQTLDLVILASASVFSVTLSIGDSLDNACRSKGRHWFCWPWMGKPLLPLISVYPERTMTRVTWSGFTT